MTDAGAAGGACRRRRRACWATCARRSPTGRRCATRCSAIVAELDKRAAADPGRGAGRGPRVPALARRQPLHVPRLSPPRTRHGGRPGRAEDRARTRAWASCARPRARTSSSSFAALPPEVRAYARRPELLVITKSTARSTVHRPGYLDYIAVKRFDAKGTVSRRAPLPRPLHVDGLQRQSGRHSAAAAQDRPTSSRARGCRPAATPARRWSTSSRPIRATSCSRPPRTTCCARRWRSCTWASASASACSSAAIRSSASCRASSTRRARTTRPSCARSGRRS